MAIPNRKDKMIFNLMKQRDKKNNINVCQRQFPDCPLIPNKQEKECKLCPYNKNL